MEPNIYLEMGLVGLAGIGLLTAGALRGWRGWLELKRMELQSAAYRRRLAAADHDEFPHRARRPEGTHPQAGSNRRGGGSLEPRLLSPPPIVIIGAPITGSPGLRCGTPWRRSGNRRVTS